MFVYQRRTRVKNYVWVAGNERIMGKAFVQPRVGNDQCFKGIGNGMAAKCKLAGCFPNLKSMTGLEPLPFIVDQADEGNGCPADLGRKLSQFVVVPFGQGIENVVLFEGIQPISFFGQ